MAFDGLFTKSIENELQILKSGRITKIHQPNALELMLHIRANGQNHKLLISIHPSYARIHLTDHSVENPAEPPMFCMLLRKHIEGGFIETIQQIDAERILEINIESKDEIGDAIKRKLVIEIMGRHSNCMLLDTENGKIIDSLKHLSPSINSYRTVMPGQTYILPPSQNKQNPFTVNQDRFEQFLNTDFDTKEIINTFAGFSPLHAEELYYRLQNHSKTYETFKQFLLEIKQIQQPTMIELGKTYFSPTNLHHLDLSGENFETLGKLLDRVYFAKAERDRVKQQAGDLERWLTTEIDKLKLKQKKLKKDYAEAKKLDTYQLYGELLMANLYQFKKGDSSTTVENYYNGENITIPLNTRKTPVENAQAYYTKYTKAKNALIMIEQQQTKTVEEIEYLEMIQQQVQHASPTDIEEIREELAEGNYLRLRQSKKKKKVTKPAPEKFISSTGIEIFVGKNNKQNDHLTFKLASKSYTWLHTKDIPGSHVVIFHDSPDEQTLTEAAILSAYFSKARESASVPVDYTLVRHVKKPNGSKPGFVIYFEQKTLFVTPNESIILQLRKNK